MKLLDHRKIEKGTLRGFVSVLLDSGLTVHDVALHERGDSRWVSLPGRPMTDSDGRVIRDESGKTKYVPIVEITDRARRDAFGKAVWSLVEGLAS